MIRWTTVSIHAYPDHVLLTAYCLANPIEVEKAVEKEGTCYDRELLNHHPFDLATH